MTWVEHEGPKGTKEEDRLSIWKFELVFTADNELLVSSVTFVTFVFKWVLI